MRDYGSKLLSLVNCPGLCISLFIQFIVHTMHFVAHLPVSPPTALPVSSITYCHIILPSLRLSRHAYIPATPRGIARIPTLASANGFVGVHVIGDTLARHLTIQAASRETPILPADRDNRREQYDNTIPRYGIQTKKILSRIVFELGYLTRLYDSHAAGFLI